MFINSKISEIQRSHYQNNFKKFYANIKFHSSAFQPRLYIYRDINGNVLEEEKDILQRWREHFQLTLNVDTPSGEEDQDNQVNDRTFSENVTDDSAAEIGEIWEIIRKTKSNRAGGEDDIIIELIKLGKTELLIKEIQQLIASVWSSESMPEDWQSCILFPIHKKGDKRDCKNYRGISLLNVIYKIFSPTLFTKEWNQ